MGFSLTLTTRCCELCALFFTCTDGLFSLIILESIAAYQDKSNVFRCLPVHVLSITLPCDFGAASAPLLGTKRPQTLNAHHSLHILVYPMPFWPSERLLASPFLTSPTTRGFLNLAPEMGPFFLPEKLGPFRFLPASDTLTLNHVSKCFCSRSLYRGRPVFCGADFQPRPGTIPLWSGSADEPSAIR